MLYRLQPGLSTIQRETEVRKVSTALPEGSILSHRCRTGYETADEVMKMLEIIIKIIIITHLFSRKLLSVSQPCSYVAVLHRDDFSLGQPGSL